MKELAQKAFDQWESVSNLKFEYWHSQPSAVGEYNSAKPDILISFSNTLFQHNHNSRWQKGICSSSFDGKGNVLAHGFFPNNDKSENWYFGELDNTPDGEINFYTTLLHEIGHTLGIEHSASNKAIMYAY
jgi:predicted Zn-dependent protease